MLLGSFALGGSSALAESQYSLLGELNTSVMPDAPSSIGSLAVDGEDAIVRTETEIAAIGPTGTLEWSVLGEHEGVGYNVFKGLAVSEGAGNVYVSHELYVIQSERLENVVEVYDSSGRYLSRITEDGGGKPVPGGLHSVAAVAVDQADGYVYVFDFDSGNSRVIDVFTAGGEYLFQIANAGGSNLGSASGMAVDDVAGALLVASEGRVYVFNAATGSYLTSWSGDNTPQKAFFSTAGIAVNNATGDVYVQTRGGQSAVVDRLTATGEYESQIRGVAGGAAFEGGEHMEGLAVSSATGDVYVGYSCRLGAEQVCPLRSSGSIPAGSQSVALVYVFSGSPVGVPHASVEAPAGVEPTSVVLRGMLDPEETGAATCEFEYGTSPSYGGRVPCEAAVPNGNAPTPVQAELRGLKSGTTYFFRLAGRNVADGATNVGEFGEAAGEFATPGPRLISEGVAGVNSEAASFEASVVPNGVPASAYFQYGTSEAYGATASAPPGVALGAGTSEAELDLRSSGLLPSTVYHYRLVVSSEVNPGEVVTIYGGDRTFTTQPASGSFSLLDSRQWQLVSPANKLGALIMALGGSGANSAGGMQASASGDAIAYETESPTEAAPPGFAQIETVLSTRGAGGWSAQDISAPHSQEAGASGATGTEFRVFSADLSLAAVVPASSEFTPLSPEASESTTYLRSDFPAGNAQAHCSSSCYRPLVSGKAGYANVPPGTVFGEEPEGVCPGSTCGPRFEGSSPDLSHVVLSAHAQLSATPAPAGGPGLYEWSAGSLQLVDVLPKGEAGPAILAGSGDGDVASGVRHAVSDDGSRIVLEGGSAGGQGLYLRDVAAGETVRLDVPQGVAGHSLDAQYMTASADASRVFFLDSGHLTADASASGADLYEYGLNRPAGSRLVDLTADPNAGEAAGVSTVIGASEDGAYVFFLASGLLADGAQAGALNLYVHHEGTTKLIAALPSEDEVFYNGRALFGRVSPNGEWVAFMSHGDLTGYDTRDAVSGHMDGEVYLYRAATGSLVCASCNPTGAQPEGHPAATAPLAGAGFAGSASWVAANVPPWSTINGSGSLIGTYYQSRYLSDSGRMFFDSSDSLVAQDVNGTVDAYEYEPVGVGDCATSSALFAARSQGCVGLVSSGTSPSESAFLDASETGGDVFFLTQARLAGQDYDSAYDVYDAQECTSAAPCPTAVPQPPACATEASCRVSPTPQPALYGAPASATFSGSGNVVAATPVIKPKPKAKPKPAKCRKPRGKGKPRSKGKCQKTGKVRRSRAGSSAAHRSRGGGKR